MKEAMSQLGMKRDVHVEDHSAGLATMKEALEFDPAKTAVLTVDMHRGHLDMTNATMPALPDEATRVLGGAGDFLGFAREHGMKVYHVVLTMREHEMAASLNRRRCDIFGKHRADRCPETEALAQYRGLDPDRIDARTRPPAR
jgi:hypothetical protein